jgi:hypothetical protein
MSALGRRHGSGEILQGCEALVSAVNSTCHAVVCLRVEDSSSSVFVKHPLAHLIQNELVVPKVEPVVLNVDVDHSCR